MNRFKRVFLGDRAFYRQVIAIVIPVIIQNSVTNFVNLLDNIMVGQLGTAQVSGVAIAGQLVFIFNLLHLCYAKMAAGIQRCFNHKPIRQAIVEPFPSPGDEAGCFRRTYDRNKSHFWKIFRIVGKLDRQSGSGNNDIHPALTG